MTMTVDPTIEATAQPVRSLVELEAIVDAGLQTFVEVGQALAEIREQRLYRERYATFEDYCAQRFGLKRQRAYEIMGAAAVVAKMSEISDKVPDRESHAAALADLQDDPPAMVEAFTNAIDATNGRVTAAAIEHAAEQIKPKPASLSRTARAATRSVVDGHLTRRSVSSRAEAGDFADDAPDYADQSQDAGPELDPSNDPRHRGGSLCNECRQRFTGDACPCMEPASSSATANEGPKEEDKTDDTLTGEDASGEDDHLTGEDAPADQPGNAEADDAVAPSATDGSAQEVQPVASNPAPPAAPSSPASLTNDRRAQDDGGTPRRYALGTDSFLTLISLLEPATVVAGLAPDQWQAARARHQTIRKWLADLDYQIFLAEQQRRSA